MPVKVSFDRNRVIAKLKAANDEALLITTQQALKDCNSYCKQDPALVESSLKASEPQKGKMVWNTPDARKKYYIRDTSKEAASNPEWMWAHKARSVHGEEWNELYQNIFKRRAREK